MYRERERECVCVCLCVVEGLFVFTCSVVSACSMLQCVVVWCSVVQCGAAQLHWRPSDLA